MVGTQISPAGEGRADEDAAGARPEGAGQAARATAGSWEAAEPDRDGRRRGAGPGGGALGPAEARERQGEDHDEDRERQRGGGGPDRGGRQRRRGGRHRGSTGRGARLPRRRRDHGPRGRGLEGRRPGRPRRPDAVPAARAGDEAREAAEAGQGPQRAEQPYVSKAALYDHIRECLAACWHHVRTRLNKPIEISADLDLGSSRSPSKSKTVVARSRQRDGGDHEADADRLAFASLDEEDPTSAGAPGRLRPASGSSSLSGAQGAGTPGRPRLRRSPPRPPDTTGSRAYTSASSAAIPWRRRGSTPNEERCVTRREFARRTRRPQHELLPGDRGWALRAAPSRCRSSWSGTADGAIVSRSRPFVRIHGWEV